LDFVSEEDGEASREVEEEEEEHEDEEAEDDDDDGDGGDDDCSLCCNTRMISLKTNVLLRGFPTVLGAWRDKRSLSS
jgi:hypothetical protein